MWFELSSMGLWLSYEFFSFSGTHTHASQSALSLFAYGANRISHVLNLESSLFQDAPSPNATLCKRFDDVLSVE